MSLKRFIITLGIFCILLGIFLFLEPKRDEAPEVTFWTYEFDEIRYTPPLSGFIEKNVFFQNPFIIKRRLEGIHENTIFEISGKENETGIEYSYEGGYTVKNLFNELSVLKSKTMAKEDPALLTKFALTADSPTIELGNDGTMEKKILLGEKNRDKSGRYILTEDFLLALPNYIADKFTGSFKSLRQNQVFSTGEDSLLEIKVQLEGKKFYLENRDREGKQNPESWFLEKGKMERVNPDGFNRFMADLRNLTFDLYPDDEGADGFAVANQLTSIEPDMTLQLTTGKKRKYIFRVFSEIRLIDTPFRPVSRSIDEFKESPSYIKEANYQAMKNHLEELSR